MPSVGMRRSTRVFGARVLRSGRRLSTARYDGSKHIRAAHGEDKWSELLDNSVNGGGSAGGRYKGIWKESEINTVAMNAEVKVEDEVQMKKVDRMCRIVYKRKGKRKRVELINVAPKENKWFGKKYARKKKRHNNCVSGASGNLADFQDPGCRIGRVALADCTTPRKHGTCIISGSRSFIPLFSISSSAVPYLFVHMQTSMHFRFVRPAYLFVAQYSGFYEKNEILTNDAEELSFQISIWRDQEDFIPVASQGSPGRDMTYSDVVPSGSDNSRKELPHTVPGLPKSALRSIQIRNSRKIQKRRRSSFRRKRGRPPSVFRALKTSGALHSEVFRIRQEGVQLTSAAPNLRSSYKSSSAKIKDIKSTLGVLTADACVNCCSANLLVSENDKCYREEGATVTLELSASNQWLLAVSKDGTKRYNLVAQKAMRPSWNNRFTHATIWMVDSGWKLEFPNRRDWLIFKELYKECYDRNFQSPSISVIPVPGVHEVSSTVDANYLPYVRPSSYITMKDDELTRALERMCANYDMDSDDEAWLSKLNEEFAGRELEELVTPDSFELVIDGIEKAIHCNPDEHLGGQAVYDFCMHLERREVIEAIHNYWIKKRKQNHSALVRIFQLYQPRRTQVIPKSVLRKKRSFKRQTSQGGRGKQRPLLQAIAAKQDVSEQQNVHKLQEAKAAAERSEGLAVLKRQRAQMLMENADLATYKALMALRIAEAAQIVENPDAVTSFFLG